MKNCELCKCSAARIYCESDQASLCWTCDAKVHSANFLVARHSRTLLCQSCKSHTPWSASGEKLGRTVSLCDRCIRRSSKEIDGEGERREESQGGNDDDFESGSDDYSDDEEEEEEDDNQSEEDGDNQVVPLSLTSPPPTASLSSNGEVSDSEEELGCSSSQRFKSRTAAVSCTVSRKDGRYFDSPSSPCIRPLKIRKIEATGGGEDAISVSGTVVIVDALERCRQQDMIANERDSDLKIYV